MQGDIKIKARKASEKKRLAIYAGLDTLILNWENIMYEWYINCEFTKVV